MSDERTRRRRQDPPEYDASAERVLPANGIEVGYKGLGAKITGRDALPLLTVLALAAALAGIVFYVDRGFKDARIEATVTARTLRNYHEWMRYDHAMISHDKKRSDCIALMDTAERKRTNEELNIGGDPLLYRCRWLGQAPAQPAMSP